MRGLKASEGAVVSTIISLWKCVAKYIFSVSWITILLSPVQLVRLSVVFVHALILFQNVVISPNRLYIGRVHMV